MGILQLVLAGFFTIKGNTPHGIGILYVKEIWSQTIINLYNFFCRNRSAE